MKNIPIILLALAFNICAGELQMKSVYLPLYIPYSEVTVGPHEVSFISRHAEPETTIAWMTSAHIPHNDISKNDTVWNPPSDANLISLFKIGISIERSLDENNKPSNNILFIIDASKSTKPDEVPFPVKDVIQLTKESLKLNFQISGKEKITFRVVEPQSEQAGGGDGGKPPN